MTTINRFEELEVWKLAREFTNSYKIRCGYWPQNLLLANAQLVALLLNRSAQWRQAIFK